MKNRRRWPPALLAAGLLAAGLTIGTAAPAEASCAPRMFVVGGFTHGGEHEMATSAPAGYEVVVINYPNNWWDVNFQYNVDVGQGALNWAVNDFYDHCGNPPSIIAGYSLGALVAGNVLQTQPAHRNIQGVLFADARRLPAYPGDPGGLEAVLPWAVPGDGLRGFQHPTLTLCNAPDPICFGSYDAGAYFTTHPIYNGWNVAFELGLHGWGNDKNIVY